MSTLSVNRVGAVVLSRVVVGGMGRADDEEDEFEVKVSALLGASNASHTVGMTSAYKMP